MNRVPLLDLIPQYASIREEVRQAINGVLETQCFILGSKVEDLEKAIAHYCGSKFAIGVSSGTDALLISLMVLDITYGDGVITTPYTFFSTAGSIARVGARPVFVDIDPTTYNIDPQKLMRLVESWKNKGNVRLKAVIPVHLYGQCAHMGPIIDLARESGLTVIEDAAQAIGAEYWDADAGIDEVKKAGSMGELGCLSFFPSKNLGGFGDGGMVITDDEALCNKIKMLRVHGSMPKYHHRLIGGNFRLDAIQAAVLSVKLKYLDKWLDKRRQNADYYDTLFKESGLIERGFISPPKPVYKSRSKEKSSFLNHHTYNQYVIKAKGRDQLTQHLKKNGIQTGIYYPIPLHLQECFTYLGYKKGDFPEAEKAASQTLALPIYPELTRNMIELVVDCIDTFYKAVYTHGSNKVCC